MQEGELLTWGGGVGRDHLLLIINICAVKNVTTGGSPKFVMGGKPKNAPPPCRKRDPPTHRKNYPSMRGSWNLSTYVDCFSGSQGIDG